MRETLVVKTDNEKFEDWQHALAGCDLEIIPWDCVTNHDAVDFALVWKPSPGALARFPNLKIIFSVGAGIDHLTGDGILPPGIPVIRMVDELLTAGMVEYVLFHVLRFHRFMPQYEQHQAEYAWRPIRQVPACERTVGILGVGEMGQASARALVNLGFDVIGWSRSKKTIEGVTGYVGPSQLNSLLSRSEILVCLLPLTDQTCHILNAENLAKLPRGAHLISAGRGGHQVESDILDALDNGQLAGAALDVFETEPLPENHPLWDHKNVYITPHIASMTVPASSSAHVYNNILRYRNREPLTHVVNMEQGY